MGPLGVCAGSKAECAVYLIAKHKKRLPKTDALPAGTSQWEGDKLDRRINQWQSSESIPDWLK
jgi:iduronate 2-sulfatase